MIRTFFALETLDPGFNPTNVLSMVVSVSGTQEQESQQRETFYRELLQRVRRLPGIEMAGGINHLPLAGDLWGWPFIIEGRPKPRPGESPSAVYRIVTPGYFETMRLPVLRGRAISERDDKRAPGVVVISERAAREYWPGEDAIGKRIAFGSDKDNSPTWLTIIGIAKDAKQMDWAHASYPEVYLAAFQNPEFLTSPQGHFAYITVVARTRGNPLDLATALKRTAWSIDRNLPISEVVTMEQAVAEKTAQPRFEMTLLATFGGIALILAAAGIYGVMNYSVSRRTREIGIRMSLGASRSEVLRMIMRQGLWEALIGSVAGIVTAVLLAKSISKMLYGVQPYDPVTFAGVIVVLGITAMLAALIPARKATRIDPVLALRNE